MTELALVLLAFALAAIWQRRRRRQWQRNIQPRIAAFVEYHDRQHWYRRCTAL